MRAHRLQWTVTIVIWPSRTGTAITRSSATTQSSAPHGHGVSALDVLNHSAKVACCWSLSGISESVLPPPGRKDLTRDVVVAQGTRADGRQTTRWPDTTRLLGTTADLLARNDDQRTPSSGKGGLRTCVWMATCSLCVDMRCHRCPGDVLRLVGIHHTFTERSLSRDHCLRRPRVARLGAA